MKQASSPSTPASAAHPTTPQTAPKAPVPLSAEQIKNVGGGLPRGGWQEATVPTATSSK